MIRYRGEPREFELAFSGAGAAGDGGGHPRRSRVIFQA